MMGDVTDADFEERVLGSKTPVLVDFWAEWCVPCHMVSPVVEEIGQDKGETLQVAKLNIDDNPDVTRRFAVMSIPTLMLFRDGLLHSKILTVDGRIAMIGSANLDRRSFELNYEVNMAVYDPEFVGLLDARQASYVARADAITLDQVRAWSPWRRIRNNALALASPLL